MFAGYPSCGISLCTLDGLLALPISSPPSLSESFGAPAIMLGIAETRCGVGVGVRICLPPAISREDIRPLSSRCHRNVFKPSGSPPSVCTSSVLFAGEGVALPELSWCSMINATSSRLREVQTPPRCELSLFRDGGRCETDAGGQGMPSPAIKRSLDVKLTSSQRPPTLQSLFSR